MLFRKRLYGLVQQTLAPGDQVHSVLARPCRAVRVEPQSYRTNIPILVIRDRVNLTAGYAMCAVVRKGSFECTIGPERLTRARGVAGTET
jgi:hypothetical protein